MLGRLFLFLCIFHFGIAYAAADSKNSRALRIEEGKEPSSTNLSYEELGEKLFFDTRLSGSNKMSCATCHDPKFGFSDGRALAIGDKGNILPRRTPSLWEVSFSTLFFWDGRASSLRQQALMPILSPNEMDQNAEELIHELSADSTYLQAFQALYSDGINLENIADAIAQYEKTITHPKSKFDLVRTGNREVLSESELRGFQIFSSSRGRCTGCHFGPSLSDFMFWDVGVKTTDRGRGAIDKQNPKAQYAFKTPSLWDLKSRNFFFHNGSAKTLREVIEQYNKGGSEFRPSLAPQIRALGLSEQEKKDLEDFLLIL